MTDLSNEELKRLAEASRDFSVILGNESWYSPDELADNVPDGEYLTACSPQRILSLLSQLEQLQAENADLKQKAVSAIDPEDSRAVAGLSVENIFQSPMRKINMTSENDTRESSLTTWAGYDKEQ